MKCLSTATIIDKTRGCSLDFHQQNNSLGRKLSWQKHRDLNHKMYLHLLRAGDVHVLGFTLIWFITHWKSLENKYCKSIILQVYSGEIVCLLFLRVCNICTNSLHINTHAHLLPSLWTMAHLRIVMEAKNTKPFEADCTPHSPSLIWEYDGWCLGNMKI